MLKELEDYDWEEAFNYATPDKVIGAGVDAATFGRDDVKAIHGIAPGDNDGDSWVICGELGDGRHFVLRAWCDYTGWDCQAGGDAEVAATRDEIIRFGCTEDDRRRMGLMLPEDSPAKSLDELGKGAQAQ